MKPNPIPSDDFEEVDFPSNAICLDDIQKGGGTELVTGSLRPASLSFDEIFKLIVTGEKVALKFRLKGEYESLRVSLLRRYKNYQEIKMVLGTDVPEYLATTATRVGTKHHTNGYECTFQLRPLSEKKNADTKRYQILGDL